MVDRALRVEVRGNARSFTATMQNASGHLRQFERQVLSTNARIRADAQRTGAQVRAIGMGYAGAASAVRRSGQSIAGTTRNINSSMAGIGTAAVVGSRKAQTSLATVDRSLVKSAGHAATLNGQFENYAGFVGFQMLGRSAIVMGGMIAAGFGLSVKAFADFEDTFALVRKTLDTSEGNFQRISQEIRELATTVPLAVTELNEVAGVAGQLGVGAEHIVSFTRVMAELGVTTNLTAEQAALSMARIAAVMQESLGDEGVGRMSSALVDLGNNFAAQEDEIVRFTERIAAGGKVTGMATSDMFAFSTAFTAVGVRAERGGTAFQRVIFDMMGMVQEGGHELEILAATAGTTAQEFAALWRKDPAMAVVEFTEGLGRAGENSNAIMSELFGNNVRTTQSFLSLAGAGDLARRTIELGRDAWEENNARAQEAETRFGTLTNRLKVLGNRIKEVAIGVGEVLAPVVEQVAEAAVGAFEAFGKLPGPVRELMLIFGAMAAAALIVAGGMAMMVFPMNVLKGMLPQLSARWAQATGAAQAHNVALLQQQVAAARAAGATIQLSGAQRTLLASGATMPGYFARAGALAGTLASSLRGVVVAAGAATVALAKVLAPVVALYAAYKVLSWAHDNLEKDFINVAGSAETAAESMGFMLDEFDTSVDRINTTGAVAKFRVENKELLDSFTEMEEWQREHALVQIAFEMQQRGASAEEIQQTVAMIQTASPYDIAFKVSVDEMGNPIAYLNEIGQAAKKAFEGLDSAGMFSGAHQLRQQLDEVGRSLGVLFETGDLQGFRSEWVALVRSMDESGQGLSHSLMDMRGGIRGMFEAMGIASDEAVEFQRIFSAEVVVGMAHGKSETEALEGAFKTLAYQARENGMLDLAIDLLRASGATDLVTQQTIAAIIAQRNAARATDDAGDAAAANGSRISLLGDSWEDVKDGAESAADELDAVYQSVNAGLSTLVAAGRATNDLQTAQMDQARAAADVRSAERDLDSVRVDNARLAEDIAIAERDLAEAYRGTAADADKIVDAERRLEDERVRAKRLPEDIAMAERELAEIRADGESTAEQILRAERRLEDLRRDQARMPEDLQRAEEKLAESRSDGGADADKILDAERKLEDLRAEQRASGDALSEKEMALTEAKQAQATAVWDQIEAVQQYDEAMLSLVASLADGETTSNTLADIQDKLREKFGLNDEQIGFLSESFIGIIEDALEVGAQFDELGGDTDILAGTFRMLGADSELMKDLLVDNVAEAKTQVANILGALGVDMETAMGAAETIFAHGGEDAAVALISALATGGGDVSKVLREYLETITDNVNPIVEGLGQTPIALPGGKEFAVPGLRMKIHKEGGIDNLPGQAMIQSPKKNLVQWAEPETQGEAFIPLARSKKRRSLKIWQKTGELLGVNEQYVEGDIRGLDPRFLNQFRMWSQAHGPFSVTSGYRSLAQQAVLYQRYLSGRGALAARPGSSQHNFGLAIDHAPHSWPIARTAPQFGLHHPVRSESWHVEPVWGRGGNSAQAGMYEALIGDPTAQVPDAPEFPHNGFFDSAPRIAEGMRKRVLEFLQQHMFATLDPLNVEGPTPGGEGLKNLAHEMLRSRGWEQFWPQFDRLVTKESSWNPRAQNPTSTAFGLGQFLNSTWAGVGISKTSDPGLQLEAMMRYIANRYGNPAAALRFHLANNWYKEGGFNGVQQFDSGGLLQPGATLAINRTGSPEPVTRFAEGGFTNYPSGKGGHGPGEFMEMWKRSKELQIISRNLEMATRAMEDAARSISDVAAAVEPLRFGTTKHPVGGPNFNALDPHIRGLIKGAEGADGLATAIERAKKALEQWEKQISEAEALDERKSLQDNIQEARDAAKQVRDDSDAFVAAKEREADAILALQKHDADLARERERNQAEARIRRAEEELEIRRQIEANREAYDFEQLSTSQRITWLTQRMAAVRKWSDEWYNYYKQRESLREDEKRQLEELAAQEARIEENRLQFAFDNMTAEQQLADLNRRIAAERKYNDEWMRLTRQRNALAEQMHDADLRRIDEAISKREDMLAELNSMLEQERNLMARMSQLQEDHAAEIKKTIDARAESLNNWAKLDERVTITWGNRIRSVIGNVRSQISAMQEHAAALTELRGRGLSEEIIEQLGLDDPRALGQVRMFINATDEELAELNALVVERGAIATRRAHEEAATAGTALAESLKSMKEEFNKALAEINEELQGIGQKHGLSYGEAIAAGMMSAVPAIQAAATALNAAMNSAAGSTGGAGSGGSGLSQGNTSAGWYHVEGKGWAQMVQTSSGGYTSTGVEKYDANGNLTYSGYKSSPPPGAKTYDSGGILPPGLSMAYNGTRQAEYVLRPSRGSSDESHRPVHVSVYAITELDGKKVAENVTEHQIEGERAILIRSGRSGVV